jgi:hypothetical protein
MGKYENGRNKRIVFGQVVCASGIHNAHLLLIGDTSHPHALRLL